MAQLVKNPSAMRETWVRPLGWEDAVERGKAIHSRTGLENSMDCIVHGGLKELDTTERLSPSLVGETEAPVKQRHLPKVTEEVTGTGRTEPRCPKSPVSRDSLDVGHEASKHMSRGHCGGGRPRPCTTSPSQP